MRNYHQNIHFTKRIVIPGSGPNVYLPSNFSQKICLLTNCPTKKLKSVKCEVMRSFFKRQQFIKYECADLRSPCMNRD